MSDEQIRELERKAAGGDLQAQEQLWCERKRAGSASFDMHAPANIESVLLHLYETGGNANTLKLSGRAITYLKRWVLSGVIATEEKRHHARAVKAARRRNRGRAPFARFR